MKLTRRKPKVTARGPRNGMGPYAHGSIEGFELAYHRGVILNIFWAGSFNAYGLIGTECNGFVCLSEAPTTSIIFDEWLKLPSAIMADPAQIKVDLIKFTTLTEVEMDEWLEHESRHGLRMRFNPFRSRG